MTLRDAFTRNAGNIERSYNSLDRSIAASSERINRNLDRIKSGAKLVGVGLATLAIPALLAKTTFETQKALGEMRSLGIKDLEALSLAAEEFSNKWSGTTKPEFIAASYDIRSGIASLTDVGVAEFSKLAALTGKATKSTTAEMTSLFATGYGIYKNMYDDMGDLEFGALFSGGIAAAVKEFKTTGGQMAAGISTLGAMATTANIPLEEQLAILGMLQATMSGAEAGTKYKAFMKSAGKAADALGLKFTDNNNQFLGMVPILEKIRGKYGETLDAMEKQELQKAFGRIEALEVVDLFYNKIGNVTGNINKMGASLRSGTKLTEQMANAMNIDPGARLAVMAQRLHNLFEILGKTVLGVFAPAIAFVNRLLLSAQKVAKAFPRLTKVVLGTAVVLGGLLVIGGAMLMIFGAIGMAIPAASIAMATFGGIATATGAAISAAFFAAFWPVTIGIAAIWALKRAWDRALIGGVREQIQKFWYTVTTVWDGIYSLFSSGKISGALRDEINRMGLWGFVKSVYMVGFRLQEFFGGFIEQIGAAFMSLGDAMMPLFEGIWAVISPIGKLLFNIAYSLGLVGAAVPSSAFKTFGQIIGFVVGVPLRILGGMIKTITVPLEYVGKMIGWVIGKISGMISAIPEFLLPKGVAAMKGKLTAGAMSLSMAAMPAVAAPEGGRAKAEVSPYSGMLAAQHTNYSQVINNQRTETAVTPPTPASQDQRPMEIKLHLDGREIHRQMINRDEEDQTRQNG